MTVQSDPDGLILLTSDEIADLLLAAVQHAGGRLLSWRLDQIDSSPRHSTTATYYAQVAWPKGSRTELLGVSARLGPATESDSRAEIFVDGERELAVWMYPKDPDLPGLRRAVSPKALAELVNQYQIFGQSVGPEHLKINIIGYRPRRRAVIKAQVGNQICYIKVLRPGAFDDVLARHNLLTSAGLPSPQVLAATDDQLLITRQLPGTALARAVFDPEEPCSAEQLIGLLDAMPEQVTQLPRRMSWSDALEQYADMVIEVLPSQQPRLDWLVTQIGSGLRGVPKGNEPTHGDFHEGQIHVSGKQIVGILDVDTIGPGRRADDLACLIAHLSTIQGMNPEQEARIRALLANWVPVFDERVDPVELRLRTAAVIISLATGPYRNQEADWQTQTSTILGAATALIRQIV